MSEQRKLIRLGNSSFAISLPKDWIDKSGLKKGDKIFLENNSNGEIIISPEFKKVSEDKEITINIDKKESSQIKREFASDYISGNYIFNFVGSIDKEKNKVVKEIIKDYISCEVVEENDGKIIVKDFFNIEEININGFINRIENNIKEMFDIIIQGIEKNKIGKKDVEEINKIDLDINKFYFLNSRIMMIGMDNPTITNILKTEPKNLFTNWWFSFYLEQTGDVIKSIAKRILYEKINGEEMKILLPILNEIKEKYVNSLKVFYTHDKKEAYRIMEQGKGILNKCENLTKQKNPLFTFVGEKLKEINNSSYQIVKIISYSKN